MLNRKNKTITVVVIWFAVAGGIALWFTRNQVQPIIMAAGPADSESFAVASAMADVLNQGNRNYRIEVFETGGSSDNIELLLAQQVDIATIQADAAIPEGVAGLARLYPDAYHLVARAGAGIEKFADLRGKRIAVPPDSSAQYESFWFLAAHYGLAKADVNALPMAEQAANFAMAQGQVDAIFRVRAPGNPAIRELIGAQDMQLVPIAQGEALALKRPSIGSGKIPVGSYRGEPALPHLDLPTPVLDRLLVARDDLNEEIAFQITRALFEQRADIVAQNRLAGLIAALEDDADSVLPAHPGARRYYDREKPGFVQRNARLASAVLYTVVIVFSGLVALRAQWLKARRVRMGKFTHRLVDLADQLRGNNSRDDLADIKTQLLDILTQAMRDLDSNKVSQAEFEHFSFNWQAVDTMVRDQLLLGDLHGTVTTSVNRGGDQ